MTLEGKVAIVTGGGQGIGKAIAWHFLMQGAKALIAEIDQEAGEESEQELATLGDVLFVQTDVSQESQVQSVIEEAKREYGRLDILVNNAGIGAGGPITELKLEDWDRVLATNLTSIFLAAKHACEELRRNKGCILNIASTRALMSEPNTEAYSASKGGIVALTHSLAISLGPEVRVNCISPGWIETGPWKKKSNRVAPDHSLEDRLQHPAGKVGVPEDIAALAVYLCSQQSGFVTGQNFVVDGGMTKKMIYVE